MIAALLAGPYAGRGGVKALAHKLGVTLQTFRAWRKGAAPSYENKQVLIALWREHS